MRRFLTILMMTVCAACSHPLPSFAQSGANGPWLDPGNLANLPGAGGAGSGTVNSGTQGQVAWYATTGTAVSGNANVTTDSLGNTLMKGKFTLNNAQGTPGGADMEVGLDSNNDSLISLDTGGANVGWGLQATDSTSLGHGHFAEFELVSALWEPFFCWGDGAGTAYNGTCGFQQPSTKQPLHLIRSTDSGPGGDMVDVESNGAGNELWAIDALGHEKFWGTSSGTITIQPQAAAGTYNFNLPSTVGLAGQVLTSQAGGSTAMTWSTVANFGNQSANTFYSGPLSGAAAAPTFRVVGAADIPATSITIANAASTGTTLNKLAKITGAPSTGVILATTDTSQAVGICVQGCGTTGSGVLQQNGITPCVFDNATTAGDYVQISSSVAGDCHDVGATYPSSGGEVLGRALVTNGGAGTNNINLFTPDVVATSVCGNPINMHTLSGATPTAVVQSASCPTTDVENYTLGANCTSFTLPAAAAVTDGEVIHIKVLQPSGGHSWTFPATLTGGAGTQVVFMASNGCASMPSMPTGTGHALLLDVLYNANPATPTYDIISCPTDGS